MRVAFSSFLLVCGACLAQETPTPKAEGKEALTTPAKPAEEGSKTKADQNYPLQYLHLVAEAMKSFQARDFKGALVYADRADAMLPPTVWTYNVRGAVAIEQRNFEEGKRLTLEALKLEPGSFEAKFNLCEIPFLQGNYADARKGWLVLYNQLAADDATGELLAYRIFLTFLLENDAAQAKEWLAKIPFPSQTPAYQYAHAAWERHAGNMEKWHEWLQSAEFIWPLAKRSAFTDVLYQLKWMKADGLTPN
jgi:hypothetical protein